MELVPIAGASGVAVSDDELPFQAAVVLAEMVKQRRLSPVHLVEVVLERVVKLNGRLRAFVTVDPESALREALRVESVLASDGPLPPFAGVPVAVKDLARTAGLRTTYSSRAFADYVPTRDDCVVTDIRAAGFVVIGKTNTPEFGLMPITESELNGRTLNPWAPDRTCGGSSGGAAAAVAAGLVPLAHGSDGAGSVRIPAACCGLVGVKPAGNPDRYRVRSGLGNEPVDGVVTRSVIDARAYLRAVSGIGDGLSEMTGVRIAVTVESPTADLVDAACVRGVELAAEALSDSGAQITWETPRWIEPSVVEDLMLLRSSSPISFGDSSPAKWGATTRGAFALATRASAADLHRAVIRVRAYAAQAAEILGRYDAILCPTLAQPHARNDSLAPGPLAEELFRRFAAFSPFAAIANLCSLPSATVPVYWTEQGSPVGVMVTGRPQGIDLVLTVCAELERLYPWAHRRPPVQ